MDRKFKIITFIDRINFFSNKFIDYYSKTFDKNEFYFLIHDKNFNSICDYLIENGFKNDQFESVKKETFGLGESVHKQNQIQKHFLNKGFIVIYVDIDELIYHEDLKNFVLKTNKKLLCPKGYKIIQTDKNDYLNIEETILSQRDSVFQTDWYSKICILKTPFNWTSGRHNKSTYPNDDEKFFLFDIGKVCKKLTLENNVISTNLYKKLPYGYSITNLEILNNKFSDILKKHNFQDIPKNIKDSNLF